MTVTVIDNNDASRYELLEDGVLAAFEDYEMRGDRIAFVHTEALEGHDGKGYGRTLVDEMLADARRRGLGVLPYCPYVAKVIARNAEAYLDLVPPDVRATFELPT